MLSAAFKLILENKEQIVLAHAECGQCNNIFFVPIIGENEPSFCPYCGIKYQFYSKDDKGQKFNIAGFPIA